MAQTVLIVEDDSNTVFLFETIIRRAGYQVLSAANTHQAQDTLRRAKPDAVLLDLSLPGESGVSLVKFIRQQRSLRHTRIIIVSAHMELIREVPRRDIDAALTKPVRAQALTKTLADVLGS